MVKEKKRRIKGKVINRKGWNMKEKHESVRKRKIKEKNKGKSERKRER